MKIRLILSIILLILINSNASDAQVTGGDFSTDKIFSDELRNRAMSERLQSSEAMPVGNVVDPDYYYVGPGDLLSIRILPIMLSEQIIMVSPENKIILPRAGGEINVKGMTLSQLIDSVRNIIHRNNPNANVNMALRQARVCLITIKGNVTFPGTYTLPASYNVSTAVKVANQTNVTQNISNQEMPNLLKLQEKQRNIDRLFSESGISSASSYKVRNITILHTDGSSSIADLEKAIASGNAGYDPFIREGDIIIVPFDKSSFPKISVSGEVNRPITLAYKPDDKISLLLGFGYGLSQNADRDNIVYIDPEKNTRRKIKVDTNDKYVGEDFDVGPGGVVIVNSKPAVRQSNHGIVSIKGEVNSPGIYTITSGQTKIKDIIETAGGFTGKAYLPLANIIRREKNSSSYNNLRRTINEKFQYSDLTLDDTTRFILNIDLKQPYVACNFIELFENGSDEFNVILQDGDVIYIPENPNRVYVFGQVNHPGFVDFVPGKSMEWYIARAGGFAEGAEASRSRIIRGSTRVWVESKDGVDVFDGDEIYVPRSPDIPLSVETQRLVFYASLAGTALSLLSLILTIISISGR